MAGWSLCLLHLAAQFMFSRNKKKQSLAAVCDTEADQVVEQPKE